MIWFDFPSISRKCSYSANNFILFLSYLKIKFSEFVARHIGEMEGIILEAETGDFLGKHRGFWFYTIGQRQGLRLPGGPWYMFTVFLWTLTMNTILSNFVYIVYCITFLLAFFFWNLKSPNFFAIINKSFQLQVGYQVKWLAATVRFSFVMLLY